MRVRVDITIPKELDKRFRRKFVLKKGDYSRKVEEIMLKELKGGLK